MSLRWRLALALALFAGLATVVTAGFAYAAAQDRLNREVDRFLAERLESVRDEPRRPGPFGIPRERIGRFTAGDELLVRSDTEAQALDRSGEVAARSGDVLLPVDDLDRALAAAGGAPRYRTVRADGVPYRVLTVALRGGGALQLGRDLTETERVLAALRWRFTGLGVGVVAAGVLVGWLLARRTTAPLEQLTRTAEHVAGTGELGAELPAPLPAGGNDETGRLARAFTTMLDALSRSRRAQQQLVQDAGHELRTPLTSLRTNLDVLERHPDLPGAQRSAVLADLRSELGELSALVEELVQLAADQRDDEGPERVDLAALSARVAARAARRHGRPCPVRGVGATVTAPPGALERAVSNLLDNAAKFSPPGAPIEVTLDGGRVSVRDHGPGIDPADQAKVFDRFYRSPAARALPGSGLGLAIVRQVAEANGGTVFACNHPEGGAVVGVELPSTP